ncbi:unnamed protein product [Parnassius mnemosyne]|uniref:ABC transporter domain-containing protein n=1 Tax=Parnassius mnemosyne TaxID=213953 RepID=A0AAV1KSZ8_9NEOP
MTPTRKYESSDVSAEKNYVRNTIQRSRESIKEKILVSRVWKIYFSLFKNSTFALNDINYSVKKGECFGLIGLNSSGKTTQFKVITCQDYATKGNIFVDGHYAHFNATRYAYSLGYCPQSYGLDYFRSGESNMKMLLRLRGHSNRKAQDVTKAWFNIIGLKRHAKKAVWSYSMGMRRRLAIGCALCSGTPVKLLDEPTAGIDVAAKHRVWAEIKRRLSHGDTVVLSSHK